jgi:N-methylhydantoinase A
MQDHLSMTSYSARSAVSAPWRIGVDVGGTFTDLVLVDREGSIHVAKVPSTPADPSSGVIAAVEQTADDLSLSCNQLLMNCSHFVHASTVATNIILERRGAPVGMLVTRGFRDSIEIRRGIRRNAWDHRVPFPPVLSPRYLRLPVSGRLDRNGQEVEALSADDIRQAIQLFKSEGVTSIAVCFYNSFLNEAHEVRAAEILAEEYQEAWVTLSSRVAHVMGEYERSSTAVLNAYIAPKIVTYMKRLSGELSERGLNCPLLVVQNNGGTLDIDRVEQRPVSLLLSGPAAGVGALALYSNAMAEPNMLSMEIGGTSCDVMLVSQEGAEMASEFSLGGYHAALPSIDIHSIGAGGGTIAGVERSGMLFVGPNGAGADPGPAAYGRGGKEPTVTDAHLVLGRLKPGTLAGDRSLDLGLAIDAIEQKIARPLGLSLDAAAMGILRLVDQQLFHAVQTVSTERGHDPRRFVLVAAGGAGPMHGASIGRKLKSKAVYVPRLAGTFCALGMLNAPVKHEFGRVFLGVLGPQSWPALQPIVTELEHEANLRLANDCFKTTDTQINCELDLRHPGQVGTLRIEIPADSDIDWSRVARNFLDAHERIYGHCDPAAVIEIAGVRVVGMGHLPPIRLEAPAAGSTTPTPIGERDVYFEDAAGRIPTRIYRGRDLMPGAIIRGPAIIEEITTSIVVGPDDICTTDAIGNFIIKFEQESVSWN